MFDVFLLIISLSCLTGILYIVLSKFPQLSAIRLDIIPSEQQLMIRNRLISNRLKGKIIAQKSTLVKGIRPVWRNFTSLFWKIYSAILERERHLQQMAMTPQEKEVAKQKIDEFLEQAYIASKDKLFMRAERLYIKIISLDSRNLDAYDGLVEMYLLQKDYQKAKETLKYLLNITKKKRDKDFRLKKDVSDLDSRLVRYYLKLGELYQYQGDNKDALESFQEAIKIDENNPKALDQLLEISIITKDVDLAREMIAKMKEVNPDNQKIIEWESRIEDLVG